MGLVLQEQVGLGGDLTIIQVMNCFAIIVYLWAVHSSQKKVHKRMGRIFLRLIMSVLILYGPANVLHNCRYTVERRYGFQPGINFEEIIRCPADTHRSGLGSDTVSRFHLLRATSIVTLTLATLVVLEMITYMRSAEGRGGSSTQDDVELAAPIDIGMGTTTSHQVRNNNTISPAAPAPMLTDTDELPLYSP
ncbi:hypothetical protein BGZ70_010667 [Mortierella alpina]|uniref:Uncharacterized protein n=1 Tax=Mortierella alpina TaxID=64518 RepID=A0A9P6LZE6_MORAP|nr:hypothetical protein BGZ70_010667 [Mortierella alpina]